MKKILLLTVLFLAGGCQTATTPPETPVPPAANEPPPPLKQRSFSADTLYSLLVAEIAGQRDRLDITLANYVHQAQKTQDPGVAERAFRIAEYLRADQAALNTALIWSRAAPEDLEAQRAAALYLARAGRYLAALQRMAQLQQETGESHFDFLALAAAQADSQTRQQLYQRFDSLLDQYPGNPPLLFGQAVLLQQEGGTQEALARLEQLAPADRTANVLLLQTRLLQSLGNHQQAQQLLYNGIQQYPQDPSLYLTLVRQLLEQNQPAQAMEVFEKLLQQQPEDDDLRLSLALVCLEAQAWEAALKHLKVLIARDAHVNVALFNLGRVYQALEQPEKALQAYGSVGVGNEYLPAQALYFRLQLQQRGIEQASQQLALTRQNHPQYAQQLYLVEIEALTEQNHTQAAWQRTLAALQAFPNDLTLIYTRAMLAEKRNDLPQLEQDLRHILAQDPENAMALNALGYTLADRHLRLEEAQALIEKAYAINAEDPAILDSLGWVHFRQGNLEEAERWLQAAYALYPDPEIAAHLGEVLWTQGHQTEARQLWQQAHEQDPNNPVLQQTLQRLIGQKEP